MTYDCRVSRWRILTKIREQAQPGPSPRLLSPPGMATINDISSWKCNFCYLCQSQTREWFLGLGWWCHWKWEKISFTRMALNGCAWLHLIWDQVFGSKSELFCPFVQYLSDLGTRADQRQMADVSQGSRNTTFKSGGNFSSKVHSAPFLCSLELSLAAEM